MRGRPPVGDGDYRRGLVLGLTMAEVMLLLVFCLLIAFAALLANGRKDLAEVQARLDELTQRAETAEKALAEAGTVKELLADRTPQGEAKIDQYWRRLVVGNEAVSQLEAAGIDVEALAARPDLVAAATALADGRSPAEITAALALADAVGQDLGLDPANTEAVAEVAGRLAEAERLAEEVATLDDALRAARTGRPVDLPPILTLAESRGFFFETGSAVLSESAATRLHDETVPTLARLIERYDVDVIEVVGHTDERPVTTGERSNLDRSLLDVVRGGPVEALVPADNAGLGLARAVAVAQILGSDRRLAGHQILPLSAGHLVDTDDRLTAGTFIGDVPERRRIEIRLRRSDVPEMNASEDLAADAPPVLTR